MTTYSRLNVDDYFLSLAKLVSERSTCRRRKVGCVLVDLDNHVQSTGYNGVPKNFTHCLDKPCEGASAPSGVDLDKCLAVHAEMNAFLQLRSDSMLTAYLTTTPCFSCAKVLSNSNVWRIVSEEWYPMPDVKDILSKANIEVDIICLQ